MILRLMMISRPPESKDKGKGYATAKESSEQEQEKGHQLNELLRQLDQLLGNIDDLHAELETS